MFNFFKILLEDYALWTNHVSGEKKKKDSFQEAFFSSNIISREEMIGHFPSNKEGFVASSHACYIHNEHKIKEKQIEDKIDLFMRN